MASLGELTIDFGIRDNAASKSIQEQLRSVILLGDAADKTGERLREMAPDDGDLQYYKRFKGEMEKIVQTWEKIEGLENGRGSVRKTKKAIGKLMPLTHGFSKGEALESIKESETAINNIIAKNKELEKVEQEEQAKAKEALDAINKKYIELGGNVEMVSKAQQRNIAVAKQFGSMLGRYFSLYGMKEILTQVIQIGGAFEQQKIALQSIIGDLGKARTLFAQIQDLAVKSPFTFQNLMADTKQLAAYSIPTDELFDTTKRLADLSAGLGVDMNRLILAYGQVNAAAVLRGQELRQFTEAGIPLVQRLAEKFTELNGQLVTTGDVFEKISKRQVSFEMVKDILWEMTDAGGQFYQMQEKLSDTLYGKFSNLQDAWTIMLGNMASGHTAMGEMLKSVAVGLTTIVNLLGTIGPMLLGTMVGRYGFMGLMGAVAKVKTALTSESATLYKRLLIEKQLKAERIQLVGLTEADAVYEQEVLNTKNRITAEDLSRLMLEDKINVGQVKQLYQEGLITKELLRQLELKGAISAETSAQIIKEGQLGRGGKFKNGLMGMVGGKAGLWGLVASFAVGAGFEIFNAIKASQAERDEAMQALQDSAAQTSEKLIGILNRFNEEVGSLTNEKLTERIEILKKAFDEEGILGPIENELKNVEGLREQYDLLTQAAQNYANVKESIAQNGGWTTDIDKDIYEDYKDSADRAEKKFQNLLKHTQSLSKAINELAANNPKAQKAIEGLQTVQDKFKKLVESGFGDALTRAISVNGAGPAGFAADVHDYIAVLNASGKELDEANKDLIEEINKGIKGIHEALNDPNGYQFSKWTFDEVRQNWDNMSQVQRIAIINMTNQVISTISQSNILIQNAMNGFLNNASFAGGGWGTGGISDLAKWQKMLQNRLDLRSTSSGAKKRIEQIINAKNTSEMDAIASVQKSIKDTKDQIANAKHNNRSTATLETELKEWQEVAKFMDIPELSLADSKKDDKKNQTEQNKRDAAARKAEAARKAALAKALKQLKEELKLLKDYQDIYEKFRSIYGKQGALDELRKKDFFANLLNEGIDPTDKLKLLQKEREKILTAAIDANEKTNLLSENSEKQALAEYEAKKKLLDVEIELLQIQLKRMSGNYENFKKIKSLTGDVGLAMAISGVTQGNGFMDYLKGELGTALQGKGYTVEQALGMDIAKQRETFDDKTLKILEEIRNEEEKLSTDSMDRVIKAIEDSRTLGQRIGGINDEYDRNVESINSQYREGGMSFKTYTDLLAQNEKNRRSAIGKATFEDFKKGDKWSMLFGDLGRLSTGTLSSLRSSLERVKGSIAGSPESTKELIGQLTKVIKELEARNPFGAIAESISGMSDARRALREFNNKQNERKEEITLSRDYGKYKSGQVVTRKQLEDDITANEDKFSDALKNTTKLFNNLEAAIKPLVGILDAVGLGGVGDFFGAITGSLGTAGSVFDAFGSASKIASGLGLKGISSTLGAVAPWAAAIGAGLQMAGPLIADLFKDEELEKYQQMVEYLADLKDVVSRIQEDLSEDISSTRSTGSIISAYNRWIEMQGKLNKQNLANARQYLSANDGGTFSSSAQHRMNGRGWQNTPYKDVAMFLNMSADELKDIREQYVDLWTTLDDEYRQYLEDYINGVDAMEDKTKELYDAITGMSFESLQSEWVSLFSTLDYTAKDFTKSFEENVKGVILSGLIGGKYKGIVNELLEDMTNAADVNDPSRWTKEEYQSYQQRYNRIMQGVAGDVEDVYAKFGWDRSGKSSSLSSGISSMTEDTADLLASYINAIRADVSVNRTILVENLPNINNNVSLMQADINKIQVNTYNIAEMFNQVINGTKRVHIA